MSAPLRTSSPLRGRLGGGVPPPEGLVPPHPAPPPWEGSFRIAGYAALFDIPDAARDRVRPGAFAATLARNRDPLPLYWQHDPRQRIGTVERIGEDAKGLRVVARIDRPTSRAAALLAARAVNGLSFGYRATQARRSPQGRELLAVDLIEISLVTHPLQHGARVHLIV